MYEARFTVRSRPGDEGALGPGICGQLGGGDQESQGVGLV